MSEVMKPEDREPNYKAAMLYHSDRADVYMAERDAALAREANLREALAALDKAASEVGRLGAVTGPQWSRLTVASLKARAVLQETKP